MGPNRVIGNKGEIPWRIPDDMKWFKRLTLGLPPERAALTAPWNDVYVPKRGEVLRNIVVMGMKTYKQVGILPGRYNYVLTRQHEKLILPSTDVMRYASYEDVITLPENNVWVIGGAEIYELLLPYCNEVFVTHVIDEYEGDAFMPAFEHRYSHQDIIKETKDYSIVRYWRKIPAGWRPLYADDATKTGDRYDSDGLWFPIEIMTPNDYKKDPTIIRYDR